MINIVPRGVYGVLTTPFTANGDIDEEKLEKEIEYCLSTEIQGLLVNGSSSEFVYMSPEQNKRVLRMAANLVGSQKILVGGVNAPSEFRVLDYLCCIAESGYTYAMLCPPYYYPQKTEDIYSFYCTICERAPRNIKILAYNIPFCAPQIPLEILPGLMEKENFVGLKDSSGDMLYLAKLKCIADTYRPEFSVFCGQDAVLLPSLTLGVQGSISSLGWMFSKPIIDLINSYDTGNYGRAELLQQNIISLVRHLDKIPFPENYRALSQVVGIDCGIPQRSFRSLEPSRLSQWKKEAHMLLQKLACV